MRSTQFLAYKLRIQQSWRKQYTIIRRVHDCEWRIVILPLLVYGCGTWSLTLKDEHRLRVFEKRVLRRKFGPKRVDVIGQWRRLRHVKFYVL